MRPRRAIGLLFSSILLIACTSSEPSDTPPVDGGSGDGVGDVSDLDAPPIDGGHDAPVGAPRSFRLGFTPFWASSSVPFGDWRWDSFASADVVSLHVDDFFGIPWDELAASATPTLNAKWVKKWDDLYAGAKATKLPVVLSLSPLTDRSRLTAKVDPATGDAMTGWDPVIAGVDGAQCHDFADADAAKWATAYVHYVDWVIARYAPDQVLIAIETNVQFYKCPKQKDGFVAWLKEIRKVLVAEHPTLPLFYSFALEHMFGNGLGGSQASCGATPVDACFDARLKEALAMPASAIGFSTYPWTWFPRDASMPKDRFLRVRKAAGDAFPIWVTETGWNTVPLRFAYDAASCTDPSKSFIDATVANEAKHEAYVKELLALADEAKLAGVVWWAARDYLDAKTAATCPCAGVTENCSRLAAFGAAELFYRAFANQGLWTVEGTPRASLGAWQTALARPLIATP